MSKKNVKYIVVCCVDREIYKLNGGKVFNTPTEASEAMLIDFKNDLENNSCEPNNTDLIKINNFDYEGDEYGISQTSAWLNGENGNYDWSVIEIYI